MQFPALTARVLIFQLHTMLKYNYFNLFSLLKTSHYNLGAYIYYKSFVDLKIIISVQVAFWIFIPLHNLTLSDTWNCSERLQRDFKASNVKRVHVWTCTLYFDETPWSPKCSIVSLYACLLFHMAYYQYKLVYYWAVLNIDMFNCSVVY